jgi:hypothetical protein
MDEIAAAFLPWMYVCHGIVAGSAVVAALKKMDWKDAQQGMARQRQLSTTSLISSVATRSSGCSVSKQ